MLPPPGLLPSHPQSSITRAGAWLRLESTPPFRASTYKLSNESKPTFALQPNQPPCALRALGLLRVLRDMATALCRQPGESGRGRPTPRSRIVVTRLIVLFTGRKPARTRPAPQSLQLRQSTSTPTRRTQGGLSQPASTPSPPDSQTPCGSPRRTSRESDQTPAAQRQASGRLPGRDRVGDLQSHQAPDPSLAS